MKKSELPGRFAHRHAEFMWLLERLLPDFKTITNFRKITVKVSGTPAEPVLTWIGECKCLQIG